MSRLVPLVVVVLVAVACGSSEPAAPAQPTPAPEPEPEPQPEAHPLPEPTAWTPAPSLERADQGEARRPPRGETFRRVDDPVVGAMGDGDLLVGASYERVFELFVVRGDLVYRLGAPSTDAQVHRPVLFDGRARPTVAVTSGPRPVVFEHDGEQWRPLGTPGESDRVVGLLSFDSVLHAVGHELVGEAGVQGALGVRATDAPRHRLTLHRRTSDGWEVVGSPYVTGPGFWVQPSVVTDFGDYAFVHRDECAERELTDFGGVLGDCSHRISRFHEGAWSELPSAGPARANDERDPGALALTRRNGPFPDGGLILATVREGTGGRRHLMLRRFGEGEWADTARLPTTARADCHPRPLAATQTYAVWADCAPGTSELGVVRAHAGTSYGSERQVLPPYGPVRGAFPPGLAAMFVDAPVVVVSEMLEGRLTVLKAADGQWQTLARFRAGTFPCTTPGAENLPACRRR